MVSDTFIPQAATDRGDTPEASSLAAFPFTREDMSMSFTIPDLAAHSTIPAGYTVIPGSVRVPRWCGDVADNGDGSWTFLPAPDYHGPASISFRTADALGRELAGNVLAEVLPANDAPEAGHVDLGQCTAGDRRIFTSFDLLNAARDADMDDLTIVSAQVAPEQGSLQSLGNNFWAFTPADGFTGRADIAFEVSDGSASASGTAGLEVMPAGGNRAPIIAPAYLGAIAEDTPLLITEARLRFAGRDPDGDPLRVAPGSVTVDEAYGAITDNGDGTWTFTPAADVHQDDVRISFILTDGQDGWARGTALLDIRPVNDAPTAGNVNLGQIDEDHALTITGAQLLANSYDMDGDVLDISSVTVDPAIGSIVDNADGTWTFTPAQNVHGEDIPLSFTVSDGNGGTAAAVALLDVLPNNAPVISDVHLNSSPEDDWVFLKDHFFLERYYDDDGDRIFISSVTVDPAYGELTCVHTSDEGYPNVWIFKPTEDLNGDVFFDFTVSDEKGGTADATARLELLPVNDAPVAGSLSLATQEDTPIAITMDMLRAHCHDVDGDALVLDHLSLRSPGAGEVSMITAISGESIGLFEPAGNFEGQAVLTYTVRDTSGVPATGQIDLTVNAVADPLNAAGTLQGYVDGLHRLDLDFSAHFPEHDGSEVYTLLSLSGLNALPHGVQLVSGGEVVWSTGDGDTLHLTREQSLGLADIFVRSPEAASFDIAVRTQTVEQSNGHTAYGMSTVHVDIVDRPHLATYNVADTDPNMPDVFWYQNGDDWSAPSAASYFSRPDREQFLDIASSPILFNNADPSDPDAVIGGVDWHGDENCLIHIEGFSTELNTTPGFDNPNWAWPYLGEVHGAMFDYWMFRWNMNDQGNTHNIFSPHLRQQYGDQTMQVVSSRTDSDFFEARSVVMGYMNEAYWLHDTSIGDFLGFDSNPYPDYLQAGWDSRFLFGTNRDRPDVLLGLLSPGGDDMNNVLVGLGGDDMLMYGKGNDTLLGGGGNDLLLINTQHHNGFLDSYALTDYVIPQLSTNFIAPGEYGFYTVVEGKIDGGDGFDTLQLQSMLTSACETTLYLNYAEHWIGDEPARHDLAEYSTFNDNFSHFTRPFGNIGPPYDYLDGKTYGNFATFKYNMINIESINLTGDQDDANTLNLNLDNLWLVTSNEYDKTLYVRGDANDTLEIRDQANWHYVGTETVAMPQSEWTKTLTADDGYHHLVSNTGVAHLYVSEDVDVHAVGDTRYDGVGNIVWEADDSLHVDSFFHTVLTGGGDDTITIDPTLLTDGRFDVTDFTRIDGGDGFDVLKLGVNQAVTNDVEMCLVDLHPTSIDNIEAIDISGNPHQANTLIMHSEAVIDVTDADNVLYVQGDADDTVYVTDAEVWSHAGTSEMGGLTYDHYTFTDGPDTTMDLYIQAQMLTNFEHV